MSPQAEAAPDPNLRSLLRDVRAGDAGALGRLYGSHADLVYRTAFRLLQSITDAEDVLQDVFVGLPHALRSYDDRGLFDAWLRTITVRTVLMRRRAALRRREEPDDALATVSASSPTFDIADRITVQRALEALPADLRIVFMLKEVEGYSHAEIGELLGITSGASAARLFRAWQALRSTRHGS
ncbi:MAG TPA: sigma-70 family RNA polymerase sigma factor [Gemmatimonadaceae bacterium]|nr:sigma-70 family RNA polymerase sigma factor [Gemmatimonadaceae bacterium]